MTEFRRDPIIGQWVLVHTQDSWGPQQYEKDDNTKKKFDTCQFCPGKERFTPGEIEAVRHNGSPANSSDWLVRVIPNKFPVLRIEGNIDFHKEGLFSHSNGVGAHEVLIETRDHYKSLADMPAEELQWVIDKYQSRVVDLTKDKRFKYVVVFKNYGESAGTSVEHPHSQIVALPMIPKYVLAELDGTQEYYDEYKRCAFCDMIQEELEEKERVVTENDDFVVFCPFVPRYPFECWIFPKRHNSSFSSISQQEKHSLAEILGQTLKRIKVCLNDPSYNFYIHISPINYEGSESYHWHIEIVPRLTQFSGFEWGTGFFVVRTAPEKAAQYLRETNIG